MVDRTAQACGAAGERGIPTEEVRAALSCFKVKVGLGGDRQNPRWWQQLPEQGVRQLADVLEAVERHLAWPVPVQECIVQLLSKSSTADRPITLTQALYRVWGQIRRPLVGGSVAEKAPF